MLKQAVRTCFFSFSLLFLGAHSLLPHNHGQQAPHDHTSLPALIDFLADLVNNNDLGKEHLEDYRTQETVLKFTPPLICTPPREWSVALIEVHQESLCPHLDEIISKRKFWIHTTSFRGPPVA